MPRGLSITDKREARRANEALGATLRFHRERKGFTQQDLASLSAVHHTTISAVENGRRRLSLHQIRSLAKALRVPPVRFL